MDKNDFIDVFLLSHSSTTTCLTQSTSQGITTSLHIRAQPLLRVGHLWATMLTPRANTTQRLPIPVSTTLLSTPTSRTTTALRALNHTLSPSQPLTPLPQLPLGPGSACRSRRHSPSPTLRPGGRLNRLTPHPLLASSRHDRHPSLRQAHRTGIHHILAHKFRRCTVRGHTRAAAQGLQEGLTRSQCLKETWKIVRLGLHLHRVLLINQAR